MNDDLRVETQVNTIFFMFSFAFAESSADTWLTQIHYSYKSFRKKTFMNFQNNPITFTL